MRYLNPVSIWLTFPGEFDEPNERDPDKEAKRKTLFEILHQAKQQDIPIVMQESYREKRYPTIEDIREEYKPLEQREGIERMYSQFKEGTVLIGGAHLRHEYVDQETSRFLPDGYQPDFSSDPVSTSKIYDKNGGRYTLAGACVAGSMHQIHAINKRLRVVADTRITLVQGKDVRRKSFYALHSLVMAPSIITTVQNACPIFE